MAIISFFAAVIVGVFAQQAVHAQLPYEYGAYSNLLSTAPHYTPCDVPWMGYLDISIYQRMNTLARQYNIRPDEIAQWYTLIQRMCPSYMDMDLYDGLASTFRTEMQARNIPHMPPTLACNPLAPHSHPAIPSVPPVGPAVPPIGPAVSSVGPVVPPMSTTSPYVNPLVTDPLLPTAPGPVTPPLEYPYKNLYAMLDRSVPRLSYGSASSIRQLLANNLPAQCLSTNPLLANQLMTNMRYDLSMASRLTSSYNYPFYSY